MPTEVYFYGTSYTYVVLGILLANVACKYLFLPVLYEMELSSTYEVLSSFVVVIENGSVSSLSLKTFVMKLMRLKPSYLSKKSFFRNERQKGMI